MKMGEKIKSSTDFLILTAFFAVFLITIIVVIAWMNGMLPGAAILATIIIDMLLLGAWEAFRVLNYYAECSEEAHRSGQ